MNRQELHRELERLQQELAKADPADPKIQRLQTDIQALLDNEASDSSHYGDLGEQLKDGIYHFDASHPQLAKTMASVIDSLALFNL